MSGRMRVTLAPDMPAMAIEVLAPDHNSVKRFALSPGRTVDVDVPSERSFIRVNLPSGRKVTIRPRSDLNYVIDARTLEESPTAGRNLRRATRGVRSKIVDVMAAVPHGHQGVEAYEYARSFDTGMRDLVDAHAVEETFGFKRQHLLMPVTHLAVGTMNETLLKEDGEFRLEPPRRDEPYPATIATTLGEVQFALPGHLRWVRVLTAEKDDDEAVVSVRFASEDPEADTVGSYLARSDYYAAEAMAEWVEEAQDMLCSKLERPFSAAVAGYLLLRLERYDLMHDWAKNLAEWFPKMSDGCVIWASQLLRQNGDVEQAQTYFFEAAKRGWPLYTEGARRLSDALRRMGHEGADALEKLGANRSTILWNSPVTARMTRNRSMEGTVTFDIAYDTPM